MKAGEFSYNELWAIKNDLMLSYFNRNLAGDTAEVAPEYGLCHTGAELLASLPSRAFIHPNQRYKLNCRHLLVSDMQRLVNHYAAKVESTKSDTPESKDSKFCLRISKRLLRTVEKARNKKAMTA